MLTGIYSCASFVSWDVIMIPFVQVFIHPLHIKTCRPVLPQRQGERRAGQSIRSGGAVVVSVFNPVYLGRV